MSADTFPCDVFLSQSAKDQAVVHPLAERLRTCRAIAARGRREAGTCGRRNLRFRDPRNKERRFMPCGLTASAKPGLKLAAGHDTKDHSEQGL